MVCTGNGLETGRLALRMSETFVCSSTVNVCVCEAAGVRMRMK